MKTWMVFVLIGFVALTRTDSRLFMSASCGHGAA
jgi:hypothetical protein